jgi:glycosyl hydrolase family 39 (putative alpha-L-iduronidase)
VGGRALNYKLAPKHQPAPKQDPTRQGRRVRHPWILRLVAVASSVAVLAPAQLLTATPAGAAGDTSFTVDLGTGAGPIPNMFSNMAFFHYKSTWNTDKIEAKAPNYVKATYPWLQNARLQFATGGCYEPYPGCVINRDLLKNPAAGPSSGYDFFPIHRAARNILRQGLKPYIDLGNVPVTMSNPAFIGFYFRINTRPPANYQAYHDYLWWMLQSLVSEFGINEVRTWRWSVISEIENRSSFETADQNPTSTQNAYFKLYDYTVGALEEVLGAPFVNVGVQCMCVIPGMWDERNILNHSVQGPNQYNGGSTTQLDFVNVSFYEQKLFEPGNLSGLDATLIGMRDRANQLGLVNLPIGVDEGGILRGIDNRELAHSVTGMTWQGSWFALFFKRLLDLNAAHFAPLSISTKNLIGGIRPSYVNVIDLASRLAGSNRLTSVKAGTPANPADQVQSVAGYNPVTKTAYVVLLNHNPNGLAGTAEPATLNLSRITPATGTTVNVKKWVVDDSHGNFWPTWQWNAAGCGIPDNGYVLSKYSSEVPINLRQQWKFCWTQNHSVYKAASTMQVVSTTDLPTPGNALSLSSTLAHHGVTLYEIGNAAVAP